MRTRRIGAALALVAAAGLGWGALSSGWYEVSTGQAMGVGLLGAERCDAIACSTVPLERLGVDANIARLGLLAAVAGALAALALLVTAGLGLARRSPAWWSKVALAMSLFAISAGLAFHLLAPFGETMTVGAPAFGFFGGAALAGATAAVVYGAIKGRAATG